METIGAKMEIIETLPFLKSFVLVVENESFAQAAKQLRISTPTVSKQINKLESLLGLQLLVRTTRKMALTEPGKLFYTQCKRILEEVDEAQGLLSEIQKNPTGRLKVISGRHFASAYLLPHIKEFLKDYPGLALELELAERIPDLEKEGIDVQIGMSMPSEGLSTVQKKIMTTQYVFCASPQYLKDFGIPKKPKDLLKHRYITHSMRKPNDTLVFGGNESVNLRPYLIVNDVQAMQTLALQGMGIIKTHDYVVKEAIANGELVEILKAYTKEKIPIYVAYSQRRILSRKIRAFIDFICERIT